jgi:hypothetical protein
MNRLITYALSTDRIFLWSDCFHIAIAPLIRKTNHAADL